VQSLAVHLTRWMEQIWRKAAMPAGWPGLGGRAGAATPGPRPRWSGSWSRLMWSGSGAGIGPELPETCLNSSQLSWRDLRISCLSCSEHFVGPPWGSRGRRFKSCRPDGAMGGFLIAREPPVSVSTCGNRLSSDLAADMWMILLSGLTGTDSRPTGANLEHGVGQREMGSRSAPARRCGFGHFGLVQVSTARRVSRPRPLPH
jgi:hypothetical protein